MAGERNKYGPGDRVRKKDGTVGVVEGYWVWTVIYKLKDDPHAYYDHDLKPIGGFNGGTRKSSRTLQQGKV